MKIIAPIDGSRFSQAAIDSLIGMRWEPGTEIMLVTVVSGTAKEASLDADAFWDFGTTVDDAERTLSAIAGDLQQSLHECKVDYAVRQGDAKEQILIIAEAWKPNLIIMGSRGNRGLERLLLGSVSQGVLSHSPCPVILAKSEGYNEIRDVQTGFKNILLAVDNSAHARAALHWLASFNWSTDTRFKLVTVIESLSTRFVSEYSTARAANIAHEHEELFVAARHGVSNLGVELAQLLKTDNVSIAVGEGDPCEAILNAAAAAGTDLIVLGSHGRTGFSKLLLGSVSQAVSVKAPCAVAVIRGIVPKSQGGMQKTGVFKLPDVSKIRVEDYERPAGPETPHVVPMG
jgi:uncharacterized protein